MKPRKYCGFEIGGIALWQLPYLGCGEATDAFIIESTSARSSTDSIAENA
jgi:hypothetical protein